MAALSSMLKEYGLVAKLDVRDLKVSLEFYVQKLGLTNDLRWQVPDVWAQVYYPNNPRAWIGLNKTAQPVTNQGSTITFLVRDIKEARARLQAEGIEVSEIEEAPGDVLLCFFQDPDQNSLGLRQDPRA